MNLPASNPSLRWRTRRGFTIIEVAMAAGVMALALSSALVVMSRGLGSLDSARCISYASQIMQSELEQMRLQPWGDGTTAGNGTTGVTSYSTTPTVIPINTNIFATGSIVSRMTLKRVASEIHPGMIKITLTIEWTTFDSRAVSRSYITYYGKNGLYDYFAA